MDDTERLQAHVVMERAAQSGCGQSQTGDAAGQLNRPGDLETGGLISLLDSLGAKFAPGTEEHSLIKSAVLELAGLRRTLGYEKSHRDELLAIVRKKCEEITTLNSLIALARLALR
jgi:hypothetical protein